MRLETQARELALIALYQRDLVTTRTLEELDEFVRTHADPPVAALAMELVRGCVEHQATLDDIIRRTAEHWELERMPVSDRNILRLGAYELLLRPQTPPKVAINEAIELAKKYSTENSPTFVNGILDRIYTTHEQGNSPAAGAERRADLHVHSTASDGSCSPERLPAMAAEAGLAALALTDHDTVDGVPAAQAAAPPAGIELVPGVELTGYGRTCAGAPPIEVHIAGLFIDPHQAALCNRLKALCAVRRERIRAICDRLRRLGIDLDAEAILRRAPGSSVGRLHVAQELVQNGYCGDTSEAFERYIGVGKPAYVPKEKLTPAECIRLVKDAGGCAVLCHPGLTEGLEESIDGLVKSGLDAIEVYSPAHDETDRARFLRMARRYGLAVSGGSDFHGAGKPEVSLGQEGVSLGELDELRRRTARARA